MGYVITIDGPAGAGKSSVARRLAQKLGIHFLDTGAFYRAIAYALDQREVHADDEQAVTKALPSIKVRIKGTNIFVNDEDVTAQIRTHHVDKIVSNYAALKPVRDSLLGLQREQVQYGSLVVEGRDVGSVVFPDADLKFFLTASPEARAERRYKDLLRRGEAVVYKDVLAQMHERDRIDSSRKLAPLTEPAGAIHVDTSLMVEDTVVNQLAFIAQQRLAQMN